MKRALENFPYVAIVDYSLGNLVSIDRALTSVGISARITDDPQILSDSAAVILPGVGAFGNAMKELHRRKLVEPLMDYAKSTRPLIGICLGMQLLFASSDEFGHHEGLGLIPGSVTRFDFSSLALESPNRRPCKVPHVGWNTIVAGQGVEHPGWENSLLNGIAPGSHMYFMHAYYAVPGSDENSLSFTEYGGTRFVSAVAAGNVVGFQFHPERSGENGLEIYRNLSRLVGNRGHE